LFTVTLPRVFLYDDGTLENQGSIPEIDASLFNIAEPFRFVPFKIHFRFYRQEMVDNYFSLDLDWNAEATLNRIEAG